jgi:hypothetical protein
MRKLAAGDGEFLRPRALEGVDRLLLVTDREDRAAHMLTRSFAGKKLLGELAHHRPLVGAGVLRLVDQDVVDAAVELVLHPRPDVLPREQPYRARDQIGEVEEAARALELLVARDQLVGDDEGGAAGVEHADQRDAAGRIADRQRKTLEGRRQVREMLADAACHQVPEAFRHQAFRRLVLGEEEFLQQSKAFERIGHGAGAA